MKVLVCDDLPAESQEIDDAISEADQPDVNIKRLFGDRLKREFNTLIEGANNAFQNGDDVLELPETAFNDADLIILDNNLAHLGIEGARLTAESVAGYIRAFSLAPYIVSINKNPDVDFDLRYLIGDYATRTDLALNTPHLANSALWTRDRASAVKEFLPWYWPRLLDAGAGRRKKIDFVRAHLDQPVCETLGFTVDGFNSLSRQARSLLSQAEETRDENMDQGESPGATATFQEIFLASGRSLPNQDERNLLYRKLERGVDGLDAIIARVVAADIDHWFRRDVLGPQEVLVDIPHLLMRMPFLLGEGASDIDHWNMAAGADENNPPFGLDGALFAAHLEQAQFDHGVWSTAPCFWWSKLRENDDLSAHFSSDDSTNWADVVFCEDRSEFLPTNPTNGGLPPVEFVAQFEGSWNRRYVADIEGMRYVPKTRFAQ